MHPLGRLITQRMELPEHRWSLPDVARRAQKAGQRLSKSTVHHLRTEMTPQISEATVRGLAAGLGVTPLTVANAALESWGIETRPAEVTDSIATIEIDPTLSDAQRSQLIALVRAMRESAGVSAMVRTQIAASSEESKGRGAERLAALTDEATEAMRHDRRLDDPNDTHQEGG